MLSRMDATASPSLAERWKPALSASALVFVGATATILAALAFEHLGGYAPCLLCLEERFAYYFAVPASALAVLAALFERARDDLREAFAPMPGAARIDDGPAIGVVFDGAMSRIDPRVERRAPGIGDDVNRRGRVGAGAHRPNQLFQVRDVDVIVRHDNVTS